MEMPQVTPMIKSVEVSNGVRLPYVEQGDPAGVPVLMLHGVSDSWRSFEPVLPHLPDAIHAFALTQRGHGDADRPATGYRTRDFAADVAAFMDALGLEQAIVVGHSMGTTNALRFAIDHPGRTRGLMLAGAFASYRGNPEVAELWETAVSRLADPVDRAFVRGFQQSTLAQPVPEAFFHTVVEESLKLPAHVWRAAFAGFLEDDFVAELGEIEAPSLILWGAHDALCSRADQEALLAAIPGARLVAYAGAGHAPHWEEPRRFAADLTAFVERVVGRRPGPQRGAVTGGSDREPLPRRSRAYS
jgi:pimeloyl-ACP methyl ester carboxylesterase